MMLKKSFIVGWGTLALGLSACGGGGDSGSSGSAGTQASAGNTSGITQAGANAAPAPLTLALKFVEFKDASGKVPLTQDQTAAVIQQINTEYAQCGMAVKLEQYQQVDPVAMKLPMSPTMDQLDSIRSAFDDPKYLVVVDTGAWDHGSMGPANAWTAMPGQSPSGAVLEGPVANDGQIVAHELGHYLGLDHVSDTSDMMNPVIYSDSVKIASDQCQTMQDTARGARVQALR